METQYAIYEKATGYIASAISGGTVPNSNDYDDVLFAHAELDGSVSMFTAHLTHLYDVTDPQAPVLQGKPDLPFSIDKTTIVADGIDEASITGLPNPCTLHDKQTGEDYITTDGTMEISIDSPGTYLFELLHPGYLIEEISIEATATS